MVLEDGKSKLKVLVGLVSGEGLLSASMMSPCCVLTCVPEYDCICLHSSLQPFYKIQISFVGNSICSTCVAGDQM